MTHYLITVKARDGTEVERHTDNNESRVATYFRLRYCGPNVTDKTIIHYLRQLMLPSYSHSYNGGMARIERL